MNTVVCRITPQRDQSVWRDIELSDENTLSDLHWVIVAAFDLDGDHPYLFFTNNHVWDRVHCYGHSDDASTRPAYDTTIGSLSLPLNKRMLYLFDFGDELLHDVKVVAHGSAGDGVEYPRVVAGEGTPPPQYPSWEEDNVGEDEEDIESVAHHCQTEAEAKPNPSLTALVPDVRRALDGHYARLYPDDLEDDPETLVRNADDVARERDLARALLEHSGASADAIHIYIEHAVEGSVLPWLNRLPRELGDHGFVGDGADLALALRKVWQSSYLTYELPMLLARAGRKDEALKWLEKNLLEYPEESPMLLVAGEAFEELGTVERAEACYRDALAWAGSNMDVRWAILAALERLLTATGKPEALKELLIAERQLQRQDQENRERALGLIGPPTARRKTPKIGRNAPCPCGSGKKYKKCCGSPAATARA